MRTTRPLTDNKFLNIHEIVDPSKGVNGFQYAERLGRDSVAFVCYDESTKKILVNKEYKPPVDAFIEGAFGGSLDKDVSTKEIVVLESKEEAGYTVDIDDVEYLGRVLVSTQMNQFCYLFIVFVTEDQFTGREPENKVEALAKTVWKTREEISDLEDWKSITILDKAISKSII